MKALDHYKVGGFVRDTLAGLTPKDVDYVVVGETPDSMVSRGFLQVGHFPVFLHPETQEEYALARSERSTGDGYADFEYVWEGVSLEQDLLRRDLTINAMALTESGEVIDPYGGRADLVEGILRHTSEHFVEDPLRVLRVARFASTCGFTVAPETNALMQSMVAQGMMAAIKGERLWQETRKALLSPTPSCYFQVLDDCGALEAIFPEVHALKGIVQRADYHAEGDAYVHTLMVLDEAAALCADVPDERRVRICFAALVHDLGKAMTPNEWLYHPDGSVRGQHPGHEALEVCGPLITTLARRLKVPTELRRFGLAMTLAHQNIHRIALMSGRGLVDLYDTLGMNRMLKHDAHYLDDIISACMADNLGRRTTMPDGTLLRPIKYPQGPWFKQAMTELHKLPVGSWLLAEQERGVSLESALSLVLGNRRREAKKIIKQIKSELESASSMEP